MFCHKPVKLFFVVTLMHLDNDSCCSLHATCVALSLFLKTFKEEGVGSPRASITSKPGEFKRRSSRAFEMLELPEEDAEQSLSPGLKRMGGVLFRQVITEAPRSD